jgi:membrane protein DedA with SNARE-associated domain
MIAELYALIPRHGTSVLFLAALLSCAGIPIPTSALMLAAGAFIAAGDMHFLPVALITLLGAILGDQIGYAAGRVGGQPLWDRFRAKPKFTPLMDRARAELDRRAVAAVIISRFPLSALGPWINLASGATRIAWPRFTLGVLVGDAVWILAYLGTGAFFAHKVKDLGATMTSGVIALTALAAAIWLGRQLWMRRRLHAA